MHMPKPIGGTTALCRMTSPTCMFLPAVLHSASKRMIRHGKMSYSKRKLVRQLRIGPLTPKSIALVRSGKARAWGPTDVPITYDPPVKDPSEIAVVRDAEADGPDLFVCWMQKAPARQLINLKNVPVMIMAAEASYHQAYDHCTAKYLNQAGVKTEYIRLQDKGVHGNGHMVMIEKNNLDIAHVIDEWVVKNVK